MAKRHHVLRLAESYSEAFLEKIDSEPVGNRAGVEELRRRLGGSLSDSGEEDAQVLEDVIAAASEGLVASSGPRYFGFVVGGALPAAVAADWLVSVWDQCAGMAILSPAAAVIEEVAGSWIRNLLRLPDACTYAFVTGGQAANTLGIACAREDRLSRLDWDVGVRGMVGSPPVPVIASTERHATLNRSLRLLGFGDASVIEVSCDSEGRMAVAELERALSSVETGRAIVCAQAGNVNSGAFDEFSAISSLTRAYGAWLHVDGAFGLWAAASPRLADLVRGVDQADSWAVDMHKWLNVPYDCGAIFCRHRESHLASMRLDSAPYLNSDDSGGRNAAEWGFESSRRARAIPVYVALRALGRDGIASLIDRCCVLALRFAERLSAGGATIGNDVVLNQVLASFGSDDQTQRVVSSVQADPALWAGGTYWHGRSWLRLSVSNWRTREEDIDLAADAILRVWREPSALPDPH